MSEKKFDFRKEYKDLYMPKDQPVLIDVPSMIFIYVDGQGSPDSAAYSNSIQALYSLTYSIKMSKMSGNQPEGYFEYVVPPLEGLWYMDDGFDINKRDEWKWRSMIRQPEFVTKEAFDRAMEECRRKKPEIDLSNVGYTEWTEGLCVQIMHTGPFSEEPKSIAKIDLYLKNNNLEADLKNDRKHHEIYLSDPRKTAPEKLKTVLRIPVIQH